MHNSSALLFVAQICVACAERAAQPPAAAAPVTADASVVADAAAVADAVAAVDATAVADTAVVSDTATGADAAAASDGSADNWRSALFPADWSPALTDSQGHFLHDFSYAGYHNSAVALPQWPGAKVFEAAGFGADPTATTDMTAPIQAALDAAGKAGGGVVHLAKGLYRVDGTLKVTKSGVVLRGDGPDMTRLYFSKSAGMAYQAHLTLGSVPKDGLELPLAATATNRSAVLHIADAAKLQVGQTVAIGWVITPQFVADHGMTGIWKAFNGKWQPFFRRKIVAIDATKNLPTVTLDVPLRSDALLRDQASVRVQTGYVSEVGVEHLGLSNAVGWDEAWLPTQAHVLALQGVADAWVDDVATFASPLGPQAGQGVGAHVLSGGLIVEASMRVTIANTHIGRAENRGDGGNGYLFELRTSSEVLMRDCSGSDGRHNFIQNWGFGTSGWVLLRCASTGGTNQLVKDDPFGIVAKSEFHHSLAMGNLIDSCTFGDGFQGVNRGNESTGAGHTATQTVMWRPSGKGEVKSLQFGWGYVIGSAPETIVTTALTDFYGGGTAPEDYTEGLGKQANLLPVSLFEAQLALRLGK